ncbi:MAG: serine/threonine protein kinase [Pyrinomonadaceae bacterium]|nr:serine/threonine protein kinase [Pyrinomonadaceae bacterium]
MKPERWHQIENLLQFALSHAPGERLAFLAEACAGDEPLRLEVESLIASYEQADSFLETHLSQIAAELRDETKTLMTDSKTLGFADTTAALPDTIDGRTISHYRLEERLGAGGMGVVFKARDLALGRDAALKILPDSFTPALRDRLLREANACAQLQHPAIATYYESGDIDGVGFIAMELVPGLTLRERLRSGPLPVDSSLAIVACLLEGLSHAHSVGMLHRDIKPENIILTGERAAKLLDFGLAKSIAAASVASEATTMVNLTGDSEVAGTIGYMSPEQVTRAGNACSTN